MENETRLERIKKILGCHSDADFARFLKVNRTQVFRWRHKGFAPSVTKLIDLLLIGTKNTEESS